MPLFQKKGYSVEQPNTKLKEPGRTMKNKGMQLFHGDFKIK
jgi:hypothetical protein